MNNSKKIAELMDLYYYLSMRDTEVFHRHPPENLANCLL